MDFEYSELQQEIRTSVRSLCARFDQEYWRTRDRERSYPEDFVRAMSEAGWLGILIPEEFGGGGLGITEAEIVLEEINRSGGSSAVCHAQMYTMGALLRHGSEEQKRRYLPQVADGSLQLQAFGVTEPNAGSDTTQITTFARKTQHDYVISGQKVFTSRFQHSDLMVLLARTTPAGQVSKKTDGMSLFLVDLRTGGDAIQAVPIDTMINHETNQLFITDLDVPADALIGEEGRGFAYLLDGLNAERILIASECIGDGRWIVERASQYANDRIVFGRKIGQN